MPWRALPLTVALAAGCHDWAHFSDQYTGDAGVDCSVAGALVCPDAGAYICDGFESGTLGAIWKPIPMSGRVTVDETCPYHGKYALHVHIDPHDANVGGNVSVAERTAETPTELQHRFIRAFFRLVGEPAGHQIRFMQQAQSQQPRTTIVVKSSDGSIAVRNNFTSSTDRVSMKPMPIDRWTCVEFEVMTGSPGGAVRVWVDAADESAAPLIDYEADFDASPPIDQGSVGLIVGPDATAAPAYDLWVDDIVMSAERVGCSP